MTVCVWCVYVCVCVCVCVCVQWCVCDGMCVLQGEVLGITRFGLAKMKESVLMLASVSAMFIHASIHTLFIATKIHAYSHLFT